MTNTWRSRWTFQSGSMVDGVWAKPTTGHMHVARTVPNRSERTQRRGANAKSTSEPPELVAILSDAAGNYSEARQCSSVGAPTTHWTTHCEPRRHSRSFTALPDIAWVLEMTQAAVLD